LSGFPAGRGHVAPLLWTRLHLFLFPCPTFSLSCLAATLQSDSKTMSFPIISSASLFPKRCHVVWQPLRHIRLLWRRGPRGLRYPCRNAPFTWLVGTFVHHVCLRTDVRCSSATTSAVCSMTVFYFLSSTTTIPLPPRSWYAFPIFALTPPLTNLAVIFCV
jgi:hypothetical protein